ncbi:MAG: hypothetical protein R6U70_02890 [Bacillota bacterium]
METVPGEFFDIGTLNTVAGAALAVYLIVRFTKPLVKSFLPDWTVRLYTLLLSWAVLAFARSVCTGLEPRTLGLTILDGFIVAFTAMSLHENISDPRAAKVKL